MPSTRDSGRAAEEAAVAFLRSRGLVVVERNFTCRIGELDIIARDGDELVIVEVRSRRDSSRGGAAYSVGPTKQRQIARVAEVYLSVRRPRFSTCRYDVVAVTGGEVEWFQDAFHPGL